MTDLIAVPATSPLPAALWGSTPAAAGADFRDVLGAKVAGPSEDAGKTAVGPVDHPKAHDEKDGLNILAGPIAIPANVFPPPWQNPTDQRSAAPPAFNLASVNITPGADVALVRPAAQPGEGALQPSEGAVEPKSLSEQTALSTCGTTCDANDEAEVKTGLMDSPASRNETLASAPLSALQPAGGVKAASNGVDRKEPATAPSADRSIETSPPVAPDSAQARIVASIAQAENFPGMPSELNAIQPPSPAAAAQQGIVGDITPGQSNPNLDVPSGTPEERTQVAKLCGAAVVSAAARCRQPLPPVTLPSPGTVQPAGGAPSKVGRDDAPQSQQAATRSKGAPEPVDKESDSAPAPGKAEPATLKVQTPLEPGQSGAGHSAQNTDTNTNTNTNTNANANANANQTISVTPDAPHPSAGVVTGQDARTPPAPDAAAANRDQPAAPAAIQSARVLERMGQSEIRVGVHTTNFGNIELQTSVNQDRVGATITTSHAELRSAMMAEMPSLERRIAEHQLQLDSLKLDVRAGTQRGDSGAPGGNQSRSQSWPQAAEVTSQIGNDISAQESSVPQAWISPHSSGLSIHA